MSLRRLGLIFGGRSGEHAVSIVSARSVARAVDPKRFEVVAMAIDRQGRWADPQTARRVLDESSDRADQVLSFEGEHRLDPRLADGSLDVAFPVLHGPYGEDGTIQGLLKTLDLPYVGAGVAGSAVAMDKLLAKRLIAQAGLPTPAWFGLDRRAWIRDPRGAIDRCQALNFPVFVKPNRLGSSVGIAKVRDSRGLAEAIENAFQYDHRLILERGIDAREIEIAVLGNDEVRASVPGEIIPGAEFYTYEDKYLDDSCQLLAPAPLDETQSGEARELAIRAYRALSLEGMARVDLFLDRHGSNFLVNEANTIPGFTSISMYPRLWALSGLAYPQLIERLIELAFERHQRESSRAVDLPK